MKRVILYILICLTAVPFTACDDFFNENPDTIINTDEYISTENEMYRGFLGLLTRLQNAGDHAIYLTDTRCNFLETAPNAPVALQNIYKYESTDGNTYADPTCYYEIVVACNDYLAKMEEFIAKVGAGMSEQGVNNVGSLISGAVRLKVWAYYKLGSIYGEAYWFDDPLQKMEDLDNTDVFEHLTDMGQVADKCIALLDNGVTLGGVNYPANLEMDWPAWIDPETESDTYEYWNYLTPQWLLLKAELLSWRCSYNDNQADWLWIRDNVLQFLYNIYTNVSIPHKDGVYTEEELDNGALGELHQFYNLNIPHQHGYTNNFFTEQVGNDDYNICSIMYDYNNHQRNRLVQYFCPAWPGDGFYLQPSRHAMDSMYISTDIRSYTQRQMMADINGTPAFSKYFYSRQGSLDYRYLRTNIFEIQPAIPLFRAHDINFLLVEAENHLGHWHEANTLLNHGLDNEFPDRGTNGLPAGWDPRYIEFLGSRGGYGNLGIVGTAIGDYHNLPVDRNDETLGKDYVLRDGNNNIIEEGITEEDRIKRFDLALAREYAREFTGEGKSYSYICKMLKRYEGDIEMQTKLADIIVAKYGDDLKGKVRASLLDDCFIDWNLQGE